MKKIIAGLIILFVLFTPFSTVVSTVKILFFLGLLYLFIRYVLPKLMDMYEDISIEREIRRRDAEASGSFELDIKRLEKLLNEKAESFLEEYDASENRKYVIKHLIEQGGDCKDMLFLYEGMGDDLVAALRKEFNLEPDDVSLYKPIVDVSNESVISYVDDDSFKEKWDKELYSVGKNELDGPWGRDEQGKIYDSVINYKWEMERPDLIRKAGLLYLLEDIDFAQFLSELDEVEKDEFLGFSNEYEKAEFLLRFDKYSEVKEHVTNMLDDYHSTVALFADNRLYYGEFSRIDNLIKSEIIHYNQIKQVVIEEDLLRISYTGGKLSLLLDDEVEKTTARGLRSLLDGYLEEK